MGSKYLDTLLLLAGLLVIGHSQQYEVEPNRAWQPSRTQRTQNPSLFGNAQSSLRRVPVARNPVSEVSFEEPRLRQPVTRGRTAGPPSSPQVFTTAPVTTQYRSRESNETPSFPEPAVDERNVRQNQPIDFNRRGSSETNRGRLISRNGLRTTTTVEPQRATDHSRSAVRREKPRQESGFAARPNPSFPTASEELSNVQGIPTRAPFSTSSEQVSSERQSAERHGYRKPQRRGSSENDSRSSEGTRFSSRTGPTSVEAMRKHFRPDPAKVSSREQFAPTSRPSSREETSPPITTEAYVEPIVSTSKQTRGRARASTARPTSIGQRPISRGQTRSNVEVYLKHDADAISEEDNYPKEFIEKIKNSAEKPKPSFVPKPKSRLSRARTFQVKPLPKPTTDSDVSESIHEETIEQGLPSATKPREVPSFNKNRYFGRPKLTTSTTTTTTTTPLARPAVSNVDTLRQRYLDKLKQSQGERQQKLSSLKPKLQTGVKPEQEKIVERKVTTVRSFTKEPFRPTSRYSRTQKNRYEPKIQPPSAPAEPQPVRFRPRFSLTSREPDSSMEPATPTVAEHARTRNRYARLRKEELSVETPEAKTSWTSDEEKPKPSDATYNFIRLRTKDLTPLASEDVMESIVNNEVFETPTTTTSTELPVTTVRSEETTESPMTTAATRSEPTTIMSSSEIIDSSVNEVTTVPTKETTTVRDQVTIMPVPSVTEMEAKAETIMTNLASASTRFRFSSKYSTEPTPENPATEVATENDAPASTLSFSTISPDTSTSSSTTITTTFSTTRKPATATKKSKPKTRTLSTTRKPAATTAKKITPKTTTPIPSFLQNRPILRNLVSLLSPTSTTTQKPKTTTRKAKPKKAKTPKPKTTKSPLTTTTTTTIKPISDNTINPLPLAVSDEEIINSTQAVINNHTSPGNTFGKVPRDELDALTPLTIINTTETPTTVSSGLADRVNIPETTEEIKNVTSQSMFFEYTSSTATTSTTTPSTTTTADYFVYGIYPNNTVVRKRAWKTFDYEKYMTPYVIFGIYPNNTIVRKFPNGTIINDEFMTSDNEIGGPSTTATSTSTTSTTTTTESPQPAAISEEPITMEPTTDATDEETMPTVTDNEIKEVPGIEETTNVPEEITTDIPQGSTTNLPVEEPTDPQTEEPADPQTEKPTDPQTEEPTNAQPEEPTDPQTETPTNSQPEEPIDPLTEEPTNAQPEEPTDPQTEKPTNAQPEEPTDPRTEEPTNVQPEESTDMPSEDSTIKSTTEQPDIDYDFDLSFLDRFGFSTEKPSTTTDESPHIPSTFWRIGLYDEGEPTSIMKTETPSTMKNTEETTIDPSLNQVLPLSLEEVQSLWTGNFTDSASNETDNVVSSSINLDKNANLLSGGPEKETISLTNIAFRALSTSGASGMTTATVTTTGQTESTTEEMTSTPVPTTRIPRVKFVTLTPSAMMTSDLQTDDAITQSSEHVQRVTKASTQIPNDLLTSVFGQLEEKASSPIPDILKDVGSKVEGDGLTAALARRIIALAMERAKSTTTEAPTTTTTETTTTNSPTTVFVAKTTKKAKSTRTTSKGQPPSLNAISQLPGGKELDDVLQKLLIAQNLEQSLAADVAAATTVKAPEDLEKAVENQIRLAEEVRKASRTMKKKKKNRTTTTPAPPPILGFLFNFFNRPAFTPPPSPTSVRSAKKVQPPSPSSNPDGQVLLLTSLPSDVDATSTTDNEVQGERQTRGQLLTAAIDVTRAVSKFMGTVITNAAQSFQSFMRNNNWGR